MPPTGNPGNRGGRPPKPVAQHLRDGTYIKGRHEKQLKNAESLPRAKAVAVPIPPPPTSAEPELKANWLRLADTLKDRIHTKDDVDAFITLVGMITECRAAYEKVTTVGRYDTDAKGIPRIAPHTKLWLDLTSRLLYYYGRFGMTPADRARNNAYEERSGNGKEADAKPEDEFTSDEAA